MAISSLGVGSGLDVEGIISKLTSLERRPLTSLQMQAGQLQARLSVVSQIKSQVSALAEAARKLSLDSAWNGMSFTSSRASAVAGTAAAGASATSFSVEVQRLAQAQSTASSPVALNTPVGTGKLTIQLGTWNHDAAPPSFSAGSASAVEVNIGPGENTLSAIASRINNANAGVTATVLRDAAGERLLVRSKETGEASGFRIQVSDDADGSNTDNSGLSRLAFDPTNGNFGMAANAVQRAQNTQATINGIPVSSANLELAEAVPGVTLQFLETTNGNPVTVTVGNDMAAVRKNLNDFVATFNALSKTLSEATTYDPDSKTGGPMQSDALIVGLRNALRGVLGSSSTGGAFSRLADVGIEIQRNGLMTIGSGTISSKRYDEALKDLPNLKTLFTAENGNSLTNGFGRKLKAFADGLLSADGSVSNKDASIRAALKRNTQEQEKVELRVGQVEKRLRAQYGALDTQMAGLMALNNYVSQQISMWNNAKQN